MQREQELAREIRAKGLRATRPRILLLGLLSEMGGHRSAEELAQELSHRGYVCSKPSIYNVLRDLYSHGLLLIADAGPGRTLYEAHREWHHHFVCRRCSAIFDVPCVVGTKPCLDQTIPGFQCDEAQVIFRGLCPDCCENKMV